MERNDMVRAFLTAGYQLAADALEYFESNQDRMQDFLNLAPGRTDGPFVTRQTIDAVLSATGPKVRVIRSYVAKRRDVTIDRVADELTKRYQRTAEILSKKPDMLNLISINRISAQTAKFSIIAMVKEANPGDRSLVVEDPTGATSVYVSDESVGEFGYLLEDEVIGIVCDNEESSENRAVKIVFPDIPLATRTATSSGEALCMFVSDVHVDEPGFMQHSVEKLAEYARKIRQDVTVFVLGDVSPDGEKARRFLSIFPSNFTVITLGGHIDSEPAASRLPDPVMVDVGGVKIFLSHGAMFQKYFERFRTSPENMLLQLLKKRHLSPTFGANPALDDDALFVDVVPDIMAIGHFHDPRTVNYKGTTIISLGSFVGNPIFWSVNLKTRETIKIDLT